MSTIPYLSQGIGVPIDPATGLPKKKKAPAAMQPWETALGARSTGLNQQYGLGAYAPGGGGVPAGGLGPVTIPGNTPDYRSLIESALGPLSAQLGAEGIADASSRDSAVIRSLGQFGEQFDPATARQAFGDDFYNQSGFESVLPQANKLAGQTTGAGMSYMARASKAHKDTVRQIRNSLAARGLLRSGELGHQLQEQQAQFDTGQYDARQQLADYLGGVQKGYTEGVRARQARISTARLEEAPRQAQLNPAIADRPATWNGSAYVYADGTLVPRELWPTGAGSPAASAAPPARPSSTPQALYSSPTGVSGGLTAAPVFRQRRDLLEGLQW